MPEEFFRCRKQRPARKKKKDRKEKSDLLNKKSCGGKRKESKDTPTLMSTGLERKWAAPKKTKEMGDQEWGERRRRSE